MLSVLTQWPFVRVEAGLGPNRLTSITNSGATSTQAYDAAGNLTSDGTHNYQYDAENRIAKVDAGTGSEASYSYDANNWRVKKLAGGFTTYYVWEGAQVIAEYSNAAAGAGGTSYYLADRLSTRMTTDTNGAFKGTQDHLPFGEDGGTSGISEKHRFTSYERDSESGSDHAINRQHQYAHGRFMQADPVGGSIGNPQSLNRYSYVGNDPVNLIDPVGLDWMTDASKRGPGVYLDGVEVMREMWGMVFSLVAMGAADILPEGAHLNRRGDGWVVDVGEDGTVDVTWLVELAALQVGNAMDDCHRFAAMVQGIAHNEGNADAFMDAMARTFTAANNSSVAEMQRAANLALPAGRPNFGSSGFKPEFRDPSNQVRHFTGGLVAGYRFGYLPALVFMNQREEPNVGGVNDADIALNSISTRLGQQSRDTRSPMLRHKFGVPEHGYKSLANEIRRLVCE